jgi:hypothetical protein
MNGYLIYHPKRLVSKFGNVTVYHDATTANQDPYVWSTSFLHTYCHMSQMSPIVGQITFWVSGDSFPDFSHLLCDLVFVTERKDYWQQANSIDRDDPIVDSEEAYIDHYQWAFQHHFKSRKRFTLKAHPLHSFQPQNTNGTLIDIVPFLTDIGLSLGELRHGLRAGFNSKPFLLGEHTSMLYEWLDRNAGIKLIGSELEKIRQSNPQLASPSKMEYLRKTARRRNPPV